MTRHVVAALYVLSLALPVGAFFWARAGVLALRAQLEGEKRRMREVEEDASIPNDGKSDVMRARGIRFTIYNDLLYLLQDVELAVLKHALRDLKGPAWLTAGGVLAGAAASIWALYLPAA